MSGAYHTGLRMAHDIARNSIKLSREYPMDRDYWLREARRHFERARWYAKWIRRGFP